MSSVGVYLNFLGRTEEAFTLYARVFDAKIAMLQRFSDLPAVPGAPELPEAERDGVLHVELPILDGTRLYGTDMLESAGHVLRIGNNTTISLQIDELAEARRIYDELSHGATETVPLEYAAWGAWWGVLLDRFGVRWMVNCAAPGPATTQA